MSRVNPIQTNKKVLKTSKKTYRVRILTILDLHFRALETMRFLRPMFSVPVSFREGFFAFITASAMLLAIRSSFIEAFKIPSLSMIPTLWIGDHIFVNKSAFELHIPGSEWFFSVPVTVANIRVPARGEVIVFVHPKDRSSVYIKRIIGLPGEMVEVRNHRPFINGNELIWNKLLDPAARALRSEWEDQGPELKQGQLFEEHYEKGSTALIFVANTKSKFADMPRRFIRQNEFFVMGDNREFSSDSRDWGDVPVSLLQGRAFRIWGNFSFSPSQGPIHFSFNRTGKEIN